jgi:RIO kinase 1
MTAYEEDLSLLHYLNESGETLWCSRVLGTIKSGKEATVYSCEAHPCRGRKRVVAKIYRMYRSFRNESIYHEGRERIYGGAVPWEYHEFETMRLFHQAGADVPEPLQIVGNVVFMEYLGGEEEPAIPLHRVRLYGDHDARALFERILSNIEIFLRCDRVHADLSAFNILYWDKTIRVIDFPQAVEAFYNPQGFSLLLRDLKNVCKYFERYGVIEDPQGLALDLWSRYTDCIL